VANKLPATKQSGQMQAPDPEAEASMEGPRRTGLLIFFLVFGVFGLWSALAPLDSAAYAPGSVTVKSYKKVVQHLEGGIVQDILVRDGDRVERGDPLLIMDETQPLAELEITRSRFISLRVREARLKAERDRLEEVIYPASLDRTDPRVAEEIAAQNEIFRARKSANESSIEILEQRIRQLENQIQGMRALRETKLELARSYEEEVEDTRALLDQGFSERTRLRELERNHASFRGEAAELTSNISSSEVQIGETRLQILLQEREFRNEVVNELGETQTQLQDVNQRIDALSDVVSRTVVRSPDAGIVNGMQVHTVGGVITSGSQIAEIVPAADELIVQSNVAPGDIDRVSQGQDATIRFSTFGSSVPTIAGRVISISADSFSEENSGATYYLARVEVTPEGMNNLGDLVLLPGMPAEVFINTGSRTFLQYLFKPISNAIARSFNEE